MNVENWFEVIYSNDIEKLNEFINNEGKDNMHEYVRAVDGLSERDYGEGAAMTGLMYMVESRNLRGVKILLKHGSDPNFGWTTYERSALSFAVQLGSVKIAKLLLSHRANVDYVDLQGYTAMNFAVQLGNVTVMQLLLDAGANLDGIRSENGTICPPLHDACSKSAELVKWLLQRGADVNQLDTHKSNALEYAETSDVMKVLLEYGINMFNEPVYSATPFNELCCNKNCSGEALRMVIEAGADVNCRGIFGYPTICSVRRLVALSLLLQNGGDLETLCEVKHAYMSIPLTPDLIECFESRLVNMQPLLAL